MQPPVLPVVPVRMVHEAVTAGDLPPLDMDAANIFSQSEHILQEHVHFLRSTVQRLTLCSGKLLSSTTFFIFIDQMLDDCVHLKQHRHFPCHLKDFLVANDSNILSASCDRSSFNALSRNDVTMVD